MQRLIALKITVICLILVGCKAFGTTVYHTCYTGCGDQREIILKDAEFLNITKYETRKPNKIHAFRIDFKVQTNLNLKNAIANYSAATFTLRAPRLNEKNNNNDVTASFLSNQLDSTYTNKSEIFFEYIASISLSRDSHDNSYDEAMAIIEKCGGLPLEPTMARMFTGWPSLVKFKPVFLKLSKEQIEINPEEWDESFFPLKKNFIPPLPTDFKCNP